MTSEGRLLFFVYYKDRPKPLHEVLELGTAYVPRESSRIENPETFKYQAGQSLHFSCLPAEIQCCIYEHVYAPCQTVGAHIIIRCGPAYRELRPEVESVEDDDTVVEFPHWLADRFVSKRWLCDTVSALAKGMHYHIDDHSWDWALNLVNRKPNASGTQYELAKTVLATMLYQMGYMRLNIDRGRKITQTLNIDHFGVFKNLMYIQMTHNDWWDELYFIRSSQTAELEIVSLSDIPLSTIREQILYMDREAADELTSIYAQSRYRSRSNSLFTDGMHDAVNRWAAENEAYKDLRKLFEKWDGSERMKTDSEFIVRICCAIEGSPNRMLRMGIRIELDGGLLLDICEIDSVLPVVEEAVEAESVEVAS